MGALKMDRAIRGPGTSPALWMHWLSKMKPPAYSLPHRERRLVVVAPHPDDEVLACGGLICSHASRGGEVMLIAVTDGEASHGVTDAAQASLMAQRRRRESTMGLADLGMSSNVWVRRLGLRDTAVSHSFYDLRDALVDCLRDDDIVISTWRMDGHSDHDATGAAAAEACAARGCHFIEAPVWMWHWAVPGDSRVPWHRLRAFEVDEALSARKQSALSAHASQLEDRPGALGPVLDTHILARAAWPAEYFFV